MDSLLHFFDILNKYSSLILVLATIVYVGFTIVLAKETRKLREVETSPFISISFDTSFVSKFKLIIKNIGKAPAYNISFEVDEKYLNFFNYKFNQKISYFAPEQEFSILSSGYKELDASEYENIPITVKYSSKDKMEFVDTFLMEWKYLDSTLIEKDGLDEIKNSFDDLNKEIKELNKTVKNKKYFISNKLSVLEIEKKDDYVQFIFSNGYIGTIANNEVSKLGFGDIEKVYRDDGDLHDESTNMRFLAEEIYHRFSEIDSKMER